MSGIREPKVTVIPRDEEAIKDIRKQTGWKLWPHTQNGCPRPRHMSIEEDRLDYGVRTD
jgi:hypothetical protein